MVYELLKYGSFIFLVDSADGIDYDLTAVTALAQAQNGSFHAIVGGNAVHHKNGVAGRITMEQVRGKRMGKQVVMFLMQGDVGRDVLERWGFTQWNNLGAWPGRDFWAIMAGRSQQAVGRERLGVFLVQLVRTRRGDDGNSVFTGKLRKPAQVRVNLFNSGDGQRAGGVDKVALGVDIDKDKAMVHGRYKGAGAGVGIRIEIL